MGGSDTYCAVCGGPLRRPYWDDDDTSFKYNENIVQRESSLLSWLEDVRLIGLNPKSKGLFKVFITGRATEDDNGIFDAERGDDQNCPDEGTPANTSSSIDLMTYDWNCESSGMPIVFPFHRACFHILGKAMGVDELDKTVLYETFRMLAIQKSYSSTLSITYHGVSESQGQYWCPLPGTEFAVMSPLEIPWLEDYCCSPPRLSSSPNGPTVQAEADMTDAFSSLPAEVMLLICSLVDAPSLLRFRAASRSAWNLKLGNSFWKMRAKADFPWLLELSRLELEESIDWAQIFQDMYRASNLSFAMTSPGLVNRARIWDQQCPQFFHVYERIMGEEAEARAQTAAIASTASSSAIYPLISNQSQATRTTVSALIRNYEDLANTEPVISVVWTEAGDLAGLQAQMLTATASESVLTDQLRIGRDRWVTGLVVTSCTDEDNGSEGSLRRVIGLELLFSKGNSAQFGKASGDKRLIYVSESKFVVGFAVTLTAQGLVSAIGLLEQAKTKAGVSGRIVDTKRWKYNTSCIKHLWYRDLPPATLSLSGSKAGYWAKAKAEEIEPCETLIFGGTDEELADLTAIAADVRLGRFEARFGTRPTRVIGSKGQALRLLPIDGQGGERLVAVHYIVRHTPVSLRFVTNRNRQLVIGPATAGDREDVWPPTVQGQPTPVLAGFYFWWFNRDSPKASLDRVGCLFREGSSSIGHSALPQGTMDQRGVYCDPQVGPPTNGQMPRLWGPQETHERDWRTLPGNVVYWLDISRPVAEIRVTVCHGSSPRSIPVVSPTLSYSDGMNPSQDTAGAEEFLPPPERLDDSTGYPWCWCHLGFGIKAELKKRPHYSHSTWNVGGKQLTGVSLWMSGKEDDLSCEITAMQMTAQGGSASPVWGPFGFDPDATQGIRRSDVLSETPNPKLLKLYFATNNQHTTREDMVLTAMETVEK